MTAESQEPRSATVGAAVTDKERWAIELVRRKTGEPISDLLRKHTLSELIEWGGRIDAALGELDPVA